MFLGCDVCGAPIRMAEGDAGAEATCHRCGTRHRVANGGVEPLVTNALRELRAARNRKDSLVWKPMLAASKAPSFDDCGRESLHPRECAEPPARVPPRSADGGARPASERAGDSLAPAAAPDAARAARPASPFARVWLPGMALVCTALGAVSLTIAQRDATEPPRAAATVTASPETEPSPRPRGVTQEPVRAEPIARAEPVVEHVAAAGSSAASATTASAPPASPRHAPTADAAAIAEGDPYDVGTKPAPLPSASASATPPDPRAEGASAADADAGAPDASHAAPSPSDAPLAQAKTPSLGDAIASAAGAPADAQPSAHASDAAPSAPPFDRGAAMAALGRTASLAASRCRVEGASGRGGVRITFAPSGAAESVSVSAPFAGTPAGQCIASRFQSIHIHAFSGSAITIRQSVAFE